VIRHIVMWSMKPQAEGADAATNARRVVELLASCRHLVPGMLEWQVAAAQPGLEADADVLLISSFTDRAALAAYQAHPHHVAMKPFIGAVRDRRHAMDIEV
jgi:hypothetical protein